MDREEGPTPKEYLPVAKTYTLITDRKSPAIDAAFIIEQVLDDLDYPNQCAAIAFITAKFPKLPDLQSEAIPKGPPA